MNRNGGVTGGNLSVVTLTGTSRNVAARSPSWSARFSPRFRFPCSPTCEPPKRAVESPGRKFSIYRFVTSVESTVTPVNRVPSTSTNRRHLRRPTTTTIPSWRT
uniref:(northern house mosquito) hypothetical protein n=1 Tax=Culex pipiens TaxID=7175 RepID=A0A8D8G033_CULPI